MDAIIKLDIIHCNIQHSREILKAYHKQKGRQRITLSKSLSTIFMKACKLPFNAMEEEGIVVHFITQSMNFGRKSSPSSIPFRKSQLTKSYGFLRSIMIRHLAATDLQLYYRKSTNTRQMFSIILHPTTKATCAWLTIVSSNGPNLLARIFVIILQNTL